LGDSWVKTNTPELELAEAVYKHLDEANLFIGFLQAKRMLVTGGLEKPSVLVFARDT
jgi:hypothetical protein